MLSHAEKEALLRNPIVQDVYSNRTRIRIRLKAFRCVNECDGQFSIGFQAGHTVHILRRTPLMAYSRGPAVNGLYRRPHHIHVSLRHPHTFEWYACLGELTGVFKPLLAKGEYATAAHLMLQFLQCYYDPDEADVEEDDEDYEDDEDEDYRDDEDIRREDR